MNRITIEAAGPLLGPRLLHILERCGTGTRVLDIGCDHARVPLALVALGRFETAVASDVHAAPLEKAQRLLALETARGRWPEGLAARVAFRQQDGVSDEALGTGDTVVIAGMGGFEILDILARGARTQEGPVRVVTAPQKSLAELMLGFLSRGVTPEVTVVAQDGRTYPVVRAEAVWLGPAKRHAVPEDRATLTRLYGLELSGVPEGFDARQSAQLGHDLRAALKPGTQAQPHPSRMRLLRYLTDCHRKGILHETENRH